MTIAVVATVLVGAACGGDSLPAATTVPGVTTSSDAAVTSTRGSGTPTAPGEPRDLDVDAQAITGFEAFGLAVDGTTIWMTDFDGGVIRSIDTVSAELGVDIEVGANPVGIAAGGGEVWVANSNSSEHTVMKIDAATGEVLATIDTGAGSSPTGVALTDDYVWVAVADKGAVAQIDRASAQLVRVIESEGPSGGQFRVDVVAMDDTVWVVDRFCGRVIHIDATTGEITAIHDDLGFESTEPDCLGGVIADGPLRLGVFEGGIFVFADVVLEGEGHVRRISRIDPATDMATVIIDLAIVPFLSGPIGQPAFIVADNAIWFSVGTRSARMDRGTGLVDFVVGGRDSTVAAFAVVDGVIWHAIAHDDPGQSGLYGVDALEADEAADS